MSNNRAESYVKIKAKLLKRVIAIILSFTLVFSFIPTPISASDDEAPSIIAHTLSLKDTVHMVYALSVPEGAEESGIIIFKGAPPSIYAHGMGGTIISKSEGYTTVMGKRVLVYSYKGLSSKEMSTDVYAVPFALINGKYVYGTPDKYSIIEYANAKKDTSSAPLLRALLSYGAKAQEYFEFNTSRPASADFVRVNVHGALLPDGMTHGMFIKDKERLPSPLPLSDSLVFGGWFADPEYTIPIGTVTENTTDAYARRLRPVVKSSFESEISPTAVPIENGGIIFNSESGALLQSCRDENNEAYLEYKNGVGTSICVSKTHSKTSLADMQGTDVFSYSIRLRAIEDTSPLTCAIAIESNKRANGNTKWCALNIASIENGGGVLSYSGCALGSITEDAVFSLNVAVNFKLSTFTYYDDDGNLLFTEDFTVPKESLAESAKEWQSLVQKYSLRLAFKGGDGLKIYDIILCEGNLWET